MKLLEQYQSSYDAERVAMDLRRNGILAQVSDKYSNTHSFASGSFKVGLWVVLDEQYEDALGLLANADYTVLNPLSEAEMLAIEGAADKASKYLFTEAFNIITNGMIILLLLGLLGYAIFYE